MRDVDPTRATSSRASILAASTAAQAERGLAAPIFLQFCVEHEAIFRYLASNARKHA